MDDAAIYAKMTAIVRDVLQHETAVVTPATQAADVPGWDSVAHIRIIVAIELEFGVRFTPTQLMEANTAGDLVVVLHELMANAAG